MKKIFTLAAVAAMAFSVSADTLYSWSSEYVSKDEETGAITSNVTEVGGKAEGIGDAARVNYSNGDPREGHEGEVFMTCCLSGKNDFATSIKVTLDEPLNAGDKVVLTGYRNKDAKDKVATVALRFGDSGPVVKEADSAYWANINPAGEADTELTTREFDVPADAADAKVFYLSRNKSGTNLFLTKVEVTRENGGATVEAINAIDENAPIYNAQGVRVNADAKGLLIQNGKKIIRK